jgi:uncharacterized protein YgbK (DUF1537 family)
LPALVILKLRVEILALADDLTGALEIGAKFAARGIASPVTTHPDVDPLGAERMQVIDTETRHLPAEEAGRRVLSLAREARRLGARLLYLKTDSTLRGNIASELEALRKAWPESRLVYVPAYPRLGRTVRDGQLYVDGLAVDRTAFARDPLNPVRQSHIPTLLQSGCEGPVWALRVEELAAAAEPAIYVCDAETEAEVARAASFTLDEAFNEATCRLAAGPAAFAEALAAVLRPGHVPAPVWPVVRTCLVVNGSRHEVSLSQVRHAQACDCLNDRWQLLALPEAQGESGLAYAACVARAAIAAIARIQPAGLVVFGGDTALAILNALGCARLEPLGEILPGVPISRLAGRPLLLITKAGGFGPPDLLYELRKRLS